ncbi:MAG: septum formation protein Maf [Rhodospirillales bacterium]|nr:septum formation protein Maf [Rhodospirillales bacterium]MSP80611.1 septum formation protein Maf [Rhodospirillales bacterium]
MRKTLVLASASSARRKILEGAGVPFVQAPSRLDEDQLKATLGAGPAPATARALALAKAQAVSASKPGAWVLGADQVLECDGRSFSKPGDKAEARAQLVGLRGREHRLVNGLALVRDGRVLWQYDDEARLWLRDFDDAFLDAYLAAAGPEVLESVGAYRLEGTGAQLFARIEGDFFSILGLPLLPLLDVLRREGILA